MSFESNSSTSLTAGVEAKAIVCRQPAWPAWVDTAVTSSTQQYSVDYLAFESVENVSGAGTPSCIVNWSAGTRNPSANVVGATTSQWNYKYALLGVDNALGALAFMYVPKGFTLDVIVSADQVLGIQDISVSFEAWGSPGEINDYLSNTVSNNVGETVNRGMLVGSIPAGAVGATWIRPSLVTLLTSVPLSNVFVTIFVRPSGTTVAYAGSTTTRGNVTWSGTPTATVSLLPVSYPREFLNSPLPWYGVRTTATSALFTNVTQVLNKGGSVLAARMAPQAINVWRATSADAATIHPAERSFLPLETGSYTYVPPSTDLADFWDSTLSIQTGSTSSFQCPIFLLGNTALAHVIFFNAPVAGTLATTINWCIEFRTTSTLFPVGISTHTLEALHQAQMILSGVGYFFSNEKHESTLRRITNFVGKAAQVALPIASSLNPAAGLAVRLLASGASSSTKQKSKPKGKAPPKQRKDKKR